MPYDGPDDPGLPDYVKKRSLEKRKQWVGAWMGRHKQCLKDGGTGKECEASAFAVANAAIKEKSLSVSLKCIGERFARKADQDVAGYDPLGGNGTQACANCLFFVNPDWCGVVDCWPAPIVATGLCKPYWTGLPDRVPEPLEVVIVDDTTKEVKNPSTPEPAVKGLQPLRFFKDQKNELRWVMVPTNKFRDSDNPPEIFAEVAHKEVLEHYKNGGRLPETWLWHEPKTKWGQADFVDYLDGFMVFSGTVDPGKEYVAEGLSKQSKLGVSHGYLGLYGDKSQGIIARYRPFELSPLPMENAANKWTSIEILSKEAAMAFTPEKRKWLVNVLGEERVKGLEADTEGMAKSLSSLGIESKEKAPDPVIAQKADAPEAKAIVAEETPAAPAEPPVLSTKEKDDILAQLKAMTEFVVASKALVDRLGQLESAVKGLQKSDDEKIAGLLTARNKGLGDAGHRASASKGNLLNPDDPKDKELAERKPVVDPHFGKSITS